MPSTTVEFVLIHAPLVGPYTWAFVAEELRRMSFPVTVPALSSPANLPGPYWQHHARAVADAVAPIPTSQPLLLVGHSGAGSLLPAIRAALDRPVAGYIFVDAGLPENNKSRLDQFESAEAANEFRQSAPDGLLPAWTDSDLREVIPDDAVRALFARELQPLPLRVYEEPLPVFPGWPDAPVGYLRFGDNPSYEAASQKAKQAGFVYKQLEGQHFHMLVDAPLVARTLVELAREMSL